jgi:hypothetical protein
MPYLLITAIAFTNNHAEVSNVAVTELAVFKKTPKLSLSMSFNT